MTAALTEHSGAIILKAYIIITFYEVHFLLLDSNAKQAATTNNKDSEDGTNPVDAQRLKLQVLTLTKQISFTEAELLDRKKRITGLK